MMPKSMSSGRGTNRSTISPSRPLSLSDSFTLSGNFPRIVSLYLQNLIKGIIQRTLMTHRELLTESVKYTVVMTCYIPISHNKMIALRSVTDHRRVMFNLSSSLLFVVEDEGGSNKVMSVMQPTQTSSDGPLYKASAHVSINIPLRSCTSRNIF